MRLALLAGLLGLCTCAGAQAAPAYVPAGTVALGAPDRWDYVVADAGRVYVAHGDRLTVVDARSGAILGAVEGVAGGAHGTGVSAATGQGFTDDGRAGEVVAFDLRTLKATRRITAAADADGIAADPVTGRMFVVEGDPMSLSVIDPRSDTVVASIAAGEKLEAAAADGRGAVYVAGEGGRDVLRIDARTAKITGRWPTPACESPHGLAVDAVGRRVFMSCANARLMVVDADTGRQVADLPIGRGSDTVAWDATRRRVFSSDGADGIVTVYQQASPDRYVALEPVKTAASGRTMAVDAQTGRLFVAAADTDPPATPGARRRPRPGTLKLLMFDPAP